MFRAFAVCISYWVLPSLGTRPSENRKEGLGDRLGWKCTLRPECRRFRLIHDCMPMRIYWKFKPQTASIVQGDRK